MKKILILFLIISSCKNVNSEKKENQLAFSKENFFDFQDCCIEKSINKERNHIKYTYNNEKCDLTIYFYPKKLDFFLENSINKDLENLNNASEIIKKYEVMALYFPGEKLEPVYEGYDEPSYYNYTFPSKIEIYKFQENSKWILIKEIEIKENDFYKLQNSDLRNISS